MIAAWDVRDGGAGSAVIAAWDARTGAVVGGTRGMECEGREQGGLLAPSLRLSCCPQCIIATVGRERRDSTRSAPLNRWVESGQPPDDAVVTREDGKLSRGNPAAASNFECR